MLVDAIKEEPLDENEVREGSNNNSLPSALFPSIKTEPESSGNAYECSTHSSNLTYTVEVKTEPEEEEEALARNEKMSIQSQTNSRLMTGNNAKVALKDARSVADQYEQNSNLSTLAEVSLATAGKFCEPHLKQQIDRARANLYPSQKSFNASVNHKPMANSFDDAPHVVPQPTIDLPQSVKDAIIASANISKNRDSSQSPYHSHGQKLRYVTVV